MLARQKRAQETSEETERRRIADAARKACFRASESYAAAARRRIEDAKRKAACRAAMSEEEKAQRRLENAKRMAAFRASLPEEEKKRRRVENAERVALMRAAKAAERSKQMQVENMASINQAWNENGIVSFPFYPVFNYESNPPIQVHFAQNQPLYQQNDWHALMPNAIPTIFPSYTVQENSIMPNNIETPPPEILETSTIIKSPQDVFGDDKSFHLKKRGRKPGTKRQRPVPVKKMRLWEWAERSKNVRGSQPNNLRAQVQQQNDAKSYNLRAQSQQMNDANTIKIQMNSLNYFNQEFEQMQKSKNDCTNLLQTILPGIQPKQDETAQIKMEYLIDSSVQKENVEKFNNGCEEQTDSSTFGVHLVKNETVPVEMEHSTNSSEQLENIGKLSDFGDQLASSTAAVCLEKVEMLNDYGSLPEDENVQIKMEFAVDSSEQIENVEPWNMFTLELSTPGVNIEKQNDIAAPMSVSDSVNDTRNPSDTNDNIPAPCSLICSNIDVDAVKTAEMSPVLIKTEPESLVQKIEICRNIAVDAVNNNSTNCAPHQKFPPISLKTDTQSLIQEIEVLKAKDVLHTVENKTLTMKIKKLEKAYEDSIKTQKSMQEQILEFMEKNYNNSANPALHQQFLPISLKTDTQSLVQEIEVFKAKDALYTVENKTLTMKIKKLENAYEDSIKTQEIMKEQIQEFMKNNKSMSNMILQIEKHNKALNEKLVALLNENCVLNNKICNLEKQNADLTSKLKFPSIKLEPL